MVKKKNKNSLCTKLIRLFSMIMISKFESKATNKNSKISTRNLLLKKKGIKSI